MSGLWVFLAFVIHCVTSANLNEECPTKGLEKVYDYVIVGGGSTGCAIANRLSEDQHATVLLLEAGSPDTSIPEAPLIKTPALRGLARFSNISLQIPTVPQKHVFKNSKSKTGILLSGRVLGGSSAINAVAYFRGGKPDFDNWVKMGAEGWSYSEVLPYFLKSEGTKIPEFENSKFHNSHGPLVTNTAERTKLVDLVFKGADELGLPVVDCNEADPLGVCLDQRTITAGEATTAARVFLHNILGRPNFTVLTKAFVTKILINSKTKTTVGVEFKFKGQIIRVKARNEVILSAGVFFSPQILQLSGIGPRNLLKQHKIPVIADLPVGENLQDGLVLFTDLFVDTPTKRIENLTDPEVMANYIYRREGIYKESLSFASILSNGKTNVGDPKLTDILLFFRDGTISNNAGFNEEAFKKNLFSTGRDGMTVGIHANHPKSRGYVKITSRNPETLPNVDPKYLDSPEDFKLLLEAIRLAEDLSKTPAFKALNGQLEKPIEECGQFKFRSTDYWRCFVAFRGFSLGHAVGTCKMGRNNDKTTVVDSRLRVKGIKKLRVADASIIPEVTSGGLYATTIMIGEKVSDMIKQDNSKYPINSCPTKSYI